MVLGLLLLFSNGLKEIFLKRSLKGVDPSLLVGIVSLSTALIVFPFVIGEGIPDLSNKFFGALVGGGITYTIAKYTYFKALQIGEISYISPLKGMVSISVVFTGWLLLDDILNLMGFIGILFTVVGVYVLSMKKGMKSFFSPFIHLFTNRGSRIYMVAVLAYGFTVSIDKIGVTESSPLFWVLCMNLFLFITVLPSIIKNSSGVLELLNKYRGVLFCAILLHSFVYILHMNAYRIYTAFISFSF